MAVTVTVEDGSGVDGANSYQSVADWKTYATQQGWDYSVYTNDQIGSALIRATRSADRWETWSGVRTYGSEQSMLWPRKAGSIQYGQYVADGELLVITDAEGLPIEEDEIPDLLVQAAAEIAWRELQSPGSMAPDYERGGAIKSLKAGSVEIVYADGATPGTTYSVIDGLLAGLLPDGPNGSAEVDLLRA
jgi:hypothetical protein